MLPIATRHIRKRLALFPVVNLDNSFAIGISEAFSFGIRIYVFHYIYSQGCELFYFIYCKGSPEPTIKIN